MTKCGEFFRMPEPDLIEMFVLPLDKLGFRYLLTGSVASMLYGEPRVTHDVDLVIFLPPEDAKKLVEAYPLPEFYVPPLEVIISEILRDRKGQFNVIHMASGLKADFHVANRDELHAWAFRNIRRYTIGDHTIKVAPPEYVIVRKLEYFREGGSEKHLRDIRAMLNVSGESINREEMNFWIQRLSVEAQWKIASS
jgi:hypothetical protein